MMTDPISDMLTRIRNASLVNKKQVALPFSKIKQALANILQREGYVAKVEVTKENHSTLVITLKYVNKEPAIQSLERVSKPGHRKYVKSNEITPILNGFGIGILSTPRGILTDGEARAAKVGGEYLCKIY